MRVRDTFARRRRRLGRIGRRDAAGPGVREGRLWFFAILTGTLVGSHDSNIRGAGPEPGEFESLVDRHYGALYRFAMSLTRNESEAGDLVQDTFLVWASKGQTLRDPSKLSECCSRPCTGGFWKGGGVSRGSRRLNSRKRRGFCPAWSPRR